MSEDTIKYIVFEELKVRYKLPKQIDKDSLAKLNHFGGESLTRAVLYLMCELLGLEKEETKEEDCK